jgi:Fe2+ transport system protein FeoA
MNGESDRRPDASAFSLTMAEKGRNVRIRRILGGPGVQRRLLGMGLAPGMEIQVVANNGGPLVIRVLESRFMIGRGMAHHVLVS